MLGFAAALSSLLLWGWRAGLGVLLGAGLGWINYRWLKQGLGPLAQLAAAQADAPHIKVPKKIYVKFAARYALIVVVVYVIFSRSLLPAAAVLGGLFTPVAAVVVETLYELAREVRQPG
jgi:hypothetical protein